MTPSANLAEIQLCVDAEIARARLEELLAECCDADVIWLNDVVQDALQKSATAAEEAAPWRHPDSSNYHSFEEEGRS